MNNFTFISSLMANVAELEAQLNAMELKLHRQKDTARNEIEEHKSRARKLQESNEMLERKISSILE